MQKNAFFVLEFDFEEMSRLLLVVSNFAEGLLNAEVVFPRINLAGDGYLFLVSETCCNNQKEALKFWNVSSLLFLTFFVL